MTAIDTLAISRRLRDAGFPEPQAEAFAEIIRDIRAADFSQLATKADLNTGLRDIDQRLTIRFGGMMVVAVGVLLAAQRYFAGH